MKATAEKANRLNQTITDLLVPYYVIFDKRTHTWKYTGATKTLKSYRLYTFIFTFILLSSLSVFVIYVGIRFKKTTMEQFLYTIIVFFLITHNLAHHINLVFYGGEAAFVGNQTPKVLQNLFQFEMQNTPEVHKRLQLYQNHVHELDILGKRIFYVFCFDVGLVTIITLLANFKKLDPVSITLRVIQPYLDLHIISSNWLFNFIRIFMFLLFNHFMCIGVRITDLILFNSAPNWVKIIDMLLTCKQPTYYAVGIYHQLHIFCSTIRPSLVACNSVSLFLYFMIIVVGTNAVIVTFNRNHYVLTVCGLAYIIYMIHDFITFVDMSCAIQQKSTSLLHKWRELGGRSKQMKRVVRSCRPLTVPAGTAGKVDRDMKIHYIDKTINEIVNVMMMI